MTIPDLIAALTGHGFVIGPKANKIVPDTLRWQVAKGRVRKTRRGVYEVGTMPRSTRTWIKGRAQRHRAVSSLLPASSTTPSPPSKTRPRGSVKAGSPTTPPTEARSSRGHGPGAAPQHTVGVQTRPPKWRCAPRQFVGVPPCGAVGRSAHWLDLGQFAEQLQPTAGIDFVVDGGQNAQPGAVVGRGPTPNGVAVDSWLLGAGIRPVG